MYDDKSPWDAVFATRTANHSGAYLAVQDDGNLVIYSVGAVLWSSNTCCH